MNISQNFTLNEFLNSETAKKDIKKFAAQFNPPANIIENIKYGAVNIAEPIRTKWGSFSPTCVYRCPLLNSAVGGSATSMHVTAEAMDETFIKDGKNISAEVFLWLLANKSTIPFTELIWEKGDLNQPNWLHIGWRKQKTQEVLYFDGKKYVNYYGSALEKHLNKK